MFEHLMRAFNSASKAATGSPKKKRSPFAGASGKSESKGELGPRTRALSGARRAPVKERAPWAMSRRPGLPQTGGGDEDKQEKKNVKPFKVVAGDSPATVGQSNKWSNYGTQGHPVVPDKTISDQFKNATPAPKGRNNGILGDKTEAQMRRDMVIDEIEPDARDFLTMRTGQTTRHVAKEISDEDYYALDEDTRASVDVNTLLREALIQDRALVKTLDKNKDGRVDWTEGSSDYYKDKTERSYAQNYSSVFGEDRPVDKEGKKQFNWNDLGEMITRSPAIEKFAKDDREYAPHLLAALQVLGQRDQENDLRSYSAGAGLVTDSERSSVTGPVSEEDDKKTRKFAVGSLAQNFKGLSAGLDQGLTMIGDKQGAVNTDMADGNVYADLVRSLRRDMATSKTFDLFGSDTPADGKQKYVDLTALEDPNYAERRGWMEMMYNLGQQDIAAGLQDANVFSNREIMDPALAEFDLNYDEWMRFLERKSGYQSPNQTRYQSTAWKLLEGEA